MKFGILVNIAAMIYNLYYINKRLEKYPSWLKGTVC